jgi:hypothetical protein
MPPVADLLINISFGTFVAVILAAAIIAAIGGHRLG